MGSPAVGYAPGMGVSSERVDLPPEQHPGNPEENPGIEPKAGYPSRDPRSG